MITGMKRSLRMIKFGVGLTWDRQSFVAAVVATLRRVPEARLRMNIFVSWFFLPCCPRLDKNLAALNPGNISPSEVQEVPQSERRKAPSSSTY